MQDQSIQLAQNKTKLTIIVFAVVFFILPLIVGIVMNIIEINSQVSEEDALKTSISYDVEQFISTELGLGDSKTVMHKIASAGDYRAILVAFISPDDFGNSMIVIIKTKDNLPELIYSGTDYDEATLRKLDIPSDLARAVSSDNGQIDKYLKAIYESSVFPENKYPLIKNLPFRSDDLRITYYFDNDTIDQDGVSIPIIEIWATDAAERRNAFSKLQSYGYDLGKYKIMISNFNNDFIEEIQVMDDEDDSEEAS